MAPKTTKSTPPRKPRPRITVKKERMHFYLTSESIDKVDKVSLKLRMSRNAYIQMLIDKALEKVK